MRASSKASPIPTRRPPPPSARRSTRSTRRSASSSASGASQSRADRLRRSRDPRGRAARRRRTSPRAKSSTTPSTASASAPATPPARAFRPFTEVAVGRRDFDQELDDSGFARSSVWGELRGGLVIDRGEKLSRRSFARLSPRGPRGRPARGPRRPRSRNASILWSPRRLTEVQARPLDRAQPTSTPDASGDGALRRHADARAQPDAARARRRPAWASTTRTASATTRRDVTFSGFAGASYAFSRIASIEARYEYERPTATSRTATRRTKSSVREVAA